ncbi:glycosyltransferase [Streptomyces sp. NBC_00140]|uniref:glycosyltransferase n=1 Tax=Streptomyces sp. NBC_00140 TaxID=2975664 RepID=UPI002258A857|nr:glycosyltransferase [Streptomyces sp. NBC_00140]MCX5328562.1 glycosyltransferase [Streptomyces sp. NBC_00140]
MTDRLRVTVVAPTGALDAAGTWLLSLLDATDRLAVEAVLLADGPLRDEFTRRGVPCVVRPAGNSVAALGGATAWLTQRLRADRPDVLLANGVKAALAAAPAAWLAGIRCVWAKHDHMFDGPLMAVLATMTDGCVATEADLLGASRHSKAVLVPFPAPGPSTLSPETARAELIRRGVRLGQDELLLLTAARPAGDNGLDDALTALAQPGLSRWRIAVVDAQGPAEPDERKRLAALAIDLGIADRVDFTGRVPDISRLVPAADAVTQGSTGWPAEPGVFAVPPAEPAEIAAALRRLSDPGTRAEPARVGKSQAVSPPGPRPCADLLAEALAEAARLTGAGLTGTEPISVMTCFWNEGEGVDRLLELLLPQLTVDGDEIVVVDDGSTDDTADRATAWASRDSRVRVLRIPHRGLPTARNAGVRAVRNALVACTDAGCVPAPDWLARLRAAWAEPHPADLLTGGYRVSGHGVAAEAMALVGYPVPEEARHPGPWTRVYCHWFGRAFEASTPSGRSMAFSHEAWQDAHGFAEHLKTAEDLAFARSVIAAGRRAALALSAEVDWEQRPTLRSTTVMYFRYGQGNGQLGDVRLLGRDVLRGVAYLAAPAAVVRGPRARGVAAVAAAVYLSLPVARAVRGRHWAALPVIPLVTAVRDLAKTAGAVRGWATR